MRIRIEQDEMINTEGLLGDRIRARGAVGGPLEPSILLCVAMLNFRQRFRGYALARAPTGFQRTVPVPVAPGTLPAGATVRPLPRPTVHPADVRVGLTPSRAFQILSDRREEEIRLLLDAFEVTFQDWEEAVRARQTTDLSDPDLALDS